MGRSAESFGRGGGRYRPQPSILILCEDAKSSRTYLEDASAYFRSYAKVEVAHAGNTDPLGIVKAAIRRRRSFEHIYIVVDRDTHANFDEAMELAGDHDSITFLPSYPCFEFWLLLHFSYTRADYGSAQALDALRNKPGMSQYAKGNTKALFDKLVNQLPDAEERAERSCVDAEVEGNVNPSTSLHTLIAVLRDLGELKPSE